MIIEFVIMPTYVFKKLIEETKRAILEFIKLAYITVLLKTSDTICEKVDITYLS